MILNENESCPHSNVCPYNKSHTCNGALPSRDTKFYCEYVVNGQILSGGVQRLSEDKTGRMNVIME